MILSSYFYGLLDCLAGQFTTETTARCAGKNFGINISPNSKEYFSIAIIPESLNINIEVLGVSYDDSIHIASRNGFTFTVYIDFSKYDDEIQKVLFPIILSHEICHFAFYYELFLKLGDNTGIVTHSNFTHSISDSFMGTFLHENQKTSRTIFDGHNIIDY
jgi:hypothetical protein